MRSIVVDVRKAVVAGLAARAGLSGVQVTYGWPGADVAERERIFTNNPRGTHAPASLRTGRVYRDEQMEFDIVLQVEGVGKSAQEADERAVVLGAEIEEYVADNAGSLGVAGLNWFRMARVEMNNLYNDRGALSEITYTVAYQARLT